jgi:hypothetical protein
MPLQASTLAIPCAGEFEGRHPAPQWGGWGADPPNPGSVPTRKIETNQILIICRSATTSSYQETPYF